ncbi:hypothetical protein [Larkinella soli]|uniref:hypothetical protein n=1 Tax=Larkinella soli TaxID=1770527 RepID=UPI000FFC583E|nr:hypothetical protein [Larkinella soli]
MKADPGRFSSEAHPTEEVSQWVPGIREALAGDREEVPMALAFGRLEACADSHSLWLIFRFPKGAGIALRTSYDPLASGRYSLHRKNDRQFEFQTEGSLGTVRVLIECLDTDGLVLHYTTRLTPAHGFRPGAFPRDLCVLDKKGDPMGTEGTVFVTQNGPTAGLAYFTITRPEAGTVLYFQNLTALNPYCQTTGTEPSGVVSADWPELGLALPEAHKPLRAGTEVVLSDAYIALTEQIPSGDGEVADRFLEALASLYPFLPKPETGYLDWPLAADQTLRSLTRSKACARTIKGHFYLNAYVGSSEKPPESMVQFAILVPLLEYENWKGGKTKISDRLGKNVITFYNEDLGVIVRWLPGEPFRTSQPSEEEDRRKIDSWYLFHILLNLGRLAELGHQDAGKMFLKSLDFAIKTAHHFDYEWPVFYDARTLKVYKAETEPGKGGEQDVPGLYAHVMLQAYTMTKEPRYLEEAETSARRLKGKGFQLLYQTNNTIMSAVALARLWQVTGNRQYYDLSRVCVANVVARMWIWDCDYGNARYYNTFMGVAPLQNAEYIAAYEEAESFATVKTYLNLTVGDPSPAIHLLLSEYNKYLLHRGRFYFPSELPEKVISTEPREGHIRRDLTVPLEDIYTGWKPAGQVGQEVYGSANALVLCTHAYFRHKKVPIMVFSEYPYLNADFMAVGPNKGEITLRLAGSPGLNCRLRVLPRDGSLPVVRVTQLLESGEETLPIRKRAGEFIELTVPGGCRLRINWEIPNRRKK